MPVAPSADASRATWSSALVLVIGLLLMLEGSGWTNQSSPQWIWVIVGMSIVLWGWRDGGLRWLTELPGTVVAFVLAGGNRQARRYEARLTSEALVYSLFMVVLLLGALLGHSNMLLLVFALLAGALVLNGYSTVTVLRQISGRRHLPDMVFAGEPFSVHLELTNRKRWLTSWLLVVEDHLKQRGFELHPSVLFERIPAHSSRVGSYEVIPQKRGVLSFLPLRISSRYPLGLWERGFELNQTEQLLILPRVGRLSAQFEQSLRSQSHSRQDAPARRGVFDEEFHRLREFRPGDSRRAIHWRTTARRNELMVREYQEQHDPEWVLLVDLWLPAEPTAHDLAGLETAISFVASCCASRSRMAHDTGLQLLICGRNFTALGEPGQGLSLRGALESLAVAEGHHEPAPGHLVEILRRRRGDGSRKLFVSTHPNPDCRLVELGAEIDAADDGLVAEFETPGSGGESLSNLFEYDVAPVPEVSA